MSSFSVFLGLTHAHFSNLSLLVLFLLFLLFFPAVVIFTSPIIKVAMSRRARKDFETKCFIRNRSAMEPHSPATLSSLASRDASIYALSHRNAPWSRYSPSTSPLLSVERRDCTCMSNITWHLPPLPSPPAGVECGIQ